MALKDALDEARIADPHPEHENPRERRRAMWENFKKNLKDLMSYFRIISPGESI